jgi:hypothetical protein
VGDQLVALRDGAKKHAESASAGAKKTLEAFADAADKVRNTFVATGDGYIGGDEKLREFLGTLYGNVVNYEGSPSPSQIARLEILEGQIADVETSFQAFVAKDVAAINKTLAAAKLEPLKVATKEEWKAKDQGGASGPSVEIEEEELGELLKLYPWLPTLGRHLFGAR